MCLLPPSSQWRLRSRLLLCEGWYLTAALAWQVLCNASQAFSEFQTGDSLKLEEENLLFLCTPLVILSGWLWRWLITVSLSRCSLCIEIQKSCGMPM